jgi:hypothetical protein
MSERKKGWLTMASALTYSEPIVQAANSGACAIVAAASISGLTAGALTVALATPDFPRNLVCYLVDANGSITAGTVTITGLDQNGEAQTEVIAITGTTVMTGLRAWSKVTSATWALVSGTVTTTDDTIAVGVGNKLGLPAGPGAVYEEMLTSTFDGDADAGTFNKTYGTYLPAGTMNGAKEVELVYRFRLPLNVY